MIRATFSFNFSRDIVAFQVEKHFCANYYLGSQLIMQQISMLQVAVHKENIALLVVNGVFCVSEQKGGWRRPKFRVINEGRETTTLQNKPMACARMDCFTRRDGALQQAGKRS